ncbi:MAG: ATP-binding protein [Chloroflexota bacterium]
MNRLWVRFSIAITTVIIFATIVALGIVLIEPWVGDMITDSSSGLSFQPLTEGEVNELADILSTHSFELPDITIYGDGFFSITGVASLDQIEAIQQTLQKLDVTFFIDDNNIYLTISESFPAIEVFESVEMPLESFLLEGQLQPTQIDRFIQQLPVDEIIMVDEPLLVQNLSISDTLSILSHQIRPAIIISIVSGIGLGIWLSHTLTAPLSRFAEAARAVGAKDLSRRVEVKGSKEVIELATTFNQMAANLERAELLRSQLMADVSHELRTPLTGLESNLRAALDKVHQLEEADLAHLYSQTHHLIQLINDLHEIALAEAKQLPLKMKETDITELIRQTTAMFTPLAEEKDVNLIQHTVQAAQLIAVDDLRLRQVLHNLLANALRHTPNGGTVTITLDQDDAITTIRIEDTGEGIAPEHVSHIFDRFYRPDPSRNRETGGAGLGLAIAKAIIEAHEGTLTANSQGIGQGTTISITLPSRST